jgi:hypothetical protein
VIFSFYEYLDCKNKIINSVGNLFLVDKINTGKYANGLYLYKIISDDKILTGRMVVEGN